MAVEKDWVEKECQSILDGRASRGDDAQLERFFDLAWRYRMAEYPEWATDLNFSGYNHRWRDYSPEAYDRRKRIAGLFQDLLEELDRSNLTAENQLNYDLFLRDLNEEIEGYRFKQECLQITQISGIHQDMAQTIEKMPVENVAQCQDVIARLKGVPEVVYDVIGLLKEGLETGATPPKITLRDVPAQIENQIVEDASAAPMLKVLLELPNSIPVNEQEQVRQQAYSAYRQEVVPAFKKLLDFVVSEYLPGCRESVSMSELPDGQAWYAYVVGKYTTTDLTPQQIQEIGLAEVKRIRGEMDRIIERLDFEGSFEDFCTFLRTDSQFFYTDPEDLLTGYRDICKRVDPELIRMFGHLPRLPYGVVRIPEYMEKSQTTAYYMPGSLSAARPGWYYANTYDLASRPKWEMEALTLHEAVPGHHFQIAISQELEGLPEFRKHDWITAYGEGWALYAESLGDEMGFYKDPYSKFGQLTYEMWRAIRLVVDPGIHALGWSRQQAIDYFKANSCKAEHDITVEVDRYIVWPGQAVAYKIGELKIKELRALAEAELGSAFDIRAFHDELLAHGGLPLDILEGRTKDWIAAQKN